ncbi:helix-turn-helix domain-containing protein [Paucibacter sediminis]|uniref:helix-turn-helix domain-containing protein n=1 Tax=Paucibacter sediminis TaxID=3019553 RepID=UPI003CC8B102
MLNRLPSDPGSFRELLSDLGLSLLTRRIARVLDVSERTVWRWLSTVGPQTARLSLWRLSRQGQSANEPGCGNRSSK